MFIFDFIREHYQLCLSCFVSLISIIVFIVRKKPNQVVDLVSQKITLLLPTFIRYAEDKFGSGNGVSKKQYVLDLVKEWFSAEKIEFTDYYFKLVNVVIEQILSTPEKK